jgi:hypothetical protein
MDKSVPSKKTVPLRMVNSLMMEDVDVGKPSAPRKRDTFAVQMFKNAPKTQCLNVRYQMVVNRSVYIITINVFAQMNQTNR